MKSFVGVVMAKLPRIAAEPLREPVHLALSYDEEVGCTGAVSLVDEIVRAICGQAPASWGSRPACASSAAHKSIDLIRVAFRGVAAHSSLTPQGVNAIEYAAQFVRFVRSRRRRVPPTRAVRRALRRALQHGDRQPDRRRHRREHRACRMRAQLGVPRRSGPSTSTRRSSGSAPRRGDRGRDAAGEPRRPGRGPDRRTAPGLDTPEDAEVIDLVTGLGGATPTAEKVAYGTEAGLFDRARASPLSSAAPATSPRRTPRMNSSTLEQIARCERLVEELIAHIRA